MMGVSRLTALAQIAFLGALAACASRSVELLSEPSGAEIQTLGGETLGTTPVILREDALEKGLSSDGLLSVRFVGPGYQPQTLIVEIRGNDSYRMNLVKMDDAFFRRYVLRDFSDEHNLMVREIMSIQGLIRTRKYEEAAKELVKFQDSYPTVAMGYLMKANLAIVAGDRMLARRFLLQAQSLDPVDPVIARMLGGARADLSSGVAGMGGGGTGTGAGGTTVLTPPGADAATAEATGMIPLVPSSQLTNANDNTLGDLEAGPAPASTGSATPTPASAPAAPAAGAPAPGGGR